MTASNTTLTIARLFAIMLILLLLLWIVDIRNASNGATPCPFGRQGCAGQQLIINNTLDTAGPEKCRADADGGERSGDICSSYEQWS
jgi:hypothetical protein